MGICNDEKILVNPVLREEVTRRTIGIQLSKLEKNHMIGGLKNN